eukprot:201584_1
MREWTHNFNEYKLIYTYIYQIKLSKYSFKIGYSFMYWEGAKTVDQTAVLGTAQGDNINDYGGYSPSELYISRKYDSLKFEILNNKIYILDKYEWNETITKAKIKWKDLKKIVNRANYKWEIVYNIKRKTEITLPHIQSLLLYTNNTILCYYFSKTYRYESNNESDESMKKRHSEYANFGRLLKETVEVFGVWFQNSEIPCFYSGLSSPMVFDGFSQQICCPLSTAATFAPAVNFARDGIVITIKNTKGAAMYFDCVPFSDFPYENERLFISGFNPLRIVGIYDIPSSSNYNDYIQTMQIFYQCIRGYVSDYQLSLKHVSICNKLYEKRLKISKHENIPTYMVSLFHKMCDSMENIVFDIGLMNKTIVRKDALRGNRYGYLDLKDLFMDKNSDWFKVDKINSLFPNSTSFTIRYVEAVPNKKN